MCLSCIIVDSNFLQPTDFWGCTWNAQWTAISFQPTDFWGCTWNAQWTAISLQPTDFWGCTWNAQWTAISLQPTDFWGRTWNAQWTAISLQWQGLTCTGETVSTKCSLLANDLTSRLWVGGWVGELGKYLGNYLRYTVNCNLHTKLISVGVGVREYLGALSFNTAPFTLYATSGWCILATHWTAISSQNI